MSWSVIIPAAGHGSRLGAIGTKLLYKICGRPIASYLLPVFAFCDQRILVLSPKSAIDHTLRVDGVSVAVQTEPRGMADAVGCGLAMVETDFVCVVWGDQIVLNADLVQRAMSVVQDYGRDMCCPVTVVDSPYTHIEHTHGKLERILQAREGDDMPVRGVSDVGVFCFRTEALREAMRKENKPGVLTGELNFLPILLYFTKWGFTNAMPTDVLSINTLADARRAERVLWERAR